MRIMNYAVGRRGKNYEFMAKFHLKNEVAGLFCQFEPFDFAQDRLKSRTIIASRLRSM